MRKYTLEVSDDKVARILIKALDDAHTRLMAEAEASLKSHHEKKSEAVQMKEQADELREHIKRTALNDQWDKALEASATPVLNNKSGYLSWWSATEKASFVLKDIKRPLTIRQIVDVIKTLERVHTTEERKLYTNFSVILSTKAKKGEVFYRDERSSNQDEYKYGLLVWRGENSIVDEVLALSKKIGNETVGNH